MRQQRSLAYLLAGILAVVSGCATHGERVAPIKLPSHQANAVEVAGAQLIGEVYIDPDHAQETFGYDIRGAGLLPVHVVVDNQASESLRVIPDQTFLLDRSGQAWPLLDHRQAAERVREHVDFGETLAGATQPSLLGALAGAIAGTALGIVGDSGAGTGAGKGAALGGAAGAILGGGEARTEIGGEVEDQVAQQSLQAGRVESGSLGHGFLFFPGKQEAKSASSLRLAVQIGTTKHVVNVPLTAATEKTD